MGCINCKRKAFALHSKIDSDFKDTNLARFEIVYNKASMALEAAEKVRYDVYNTKEIFHELTKTKKITRLRIVESFKILFWTLASTNGGILGNNVWISSQKPFLHIKNLENIYTESKQVIEYARDYLAALYEGPEKLENSILQLQEIISGLDQLNSAFEDQVKNFGLNPRVKEESRKNVKFNSKKIKSDLRLLEKLKFSVEKEAMKFNTLLPIISKMITSSMEVGTKAFLENIKGPSEIFDKYHPEGIEAKGKAKNKVRSPRKSRESKDKNSFMKLYKVRVETFSE